MNLWTYSVDVEGVRKAMPVTLADLMIAIIVTIVTIVAAKNLPGLLEISLLNRFVDLPVAAEHLIEGTVRLALFLGYVWAIGHIEDVKRVFGYHGAEHKTINAYEQGVELVPEKVARCSIVHPRCGTAFLLIVMVISIFVFALVGDPNIWIKIASRILLIPVIAGIAYEFLKFSAAHQANPLIKVLIAPGLALQGMTTREPDLTMVEVSIAALKKLLAEEQLATAEAGAVDAGDSMPAQSSASP